MIDARLDKHPNAQGTFFDSSQYQYLVKSIGIPTEDTDPSANYVPMEVDESGFVDDDLDEETEIISATVSGKWQRFRFLQH